MADLTDYYYERAGQPVGPLPADELLAHGVQPATLVWQTGMAAWASAGSVPGLREVFVPQPPPLPGKLAGGELPSSPTLPPALGAPPTMPVPAPAPAATARPQFSTERSGSRPWWHFVLLAVFVLFCLLGARACGVVLSHLLSTASAPPPALASALAGLPQPLHPGGWKA